MSAADNDTVVLNDNHTKALEFLTAVEMLAEPSPVNVAEMLGTTVTAFRRIPKMCFDYFGVRVLKGTVSGQRKQIFMVVDWGFINKEAVTAFYSTRLTAVAKTKNLPLKAG